MSYNVFDWNRYINDYPELNINDKKNAYYHWTSHNKNKGEYKGYILDTNTNININNKIYKKIAYHHWAVHNKIKKSYNKNIHIKVNNDVYITQLIKFIIVTSTLIDSIANNLAYILNKYGYYACIKFQLSDEDIYNNNNKIIYIIIHNTRIDKLLPKYYIAYQVEQSNYIGWDNKYMEFLQNAICIWEMSMKNYDKYIDIPLTKIYYMPLPTNFNDSDNIYNTLSYDLFFYGTYNARRNIIINKLKQKYNIRIGFGIFGNKRDELIKSSKIIINLHYYDNASVESSRFNEILKYNKVIISEKSESIYDQYNMQLYNDYVDFIDVIDNKYTNMENLYNIIDKYLNNNDMYNKKVKYIQEHKYKLQYHSEYIINKNLKFMQKLNNTEIDYKLETNKIYCITLVEVPNRFNIFINQQNYNLIKNDLIFYPAIKIDPGWKGCAYSHVNLIYNAKKYGLSNITVCEDDCCFNIDFNTKYNIIKEFLNIIGETEWDLFNGVISSLYTNTVLKKVYKYKNMIFIEINKMLSTVFTIYNKSCYDKIINAYNKNNQNINTIDKFLGTSNFKIITSMPFEFSCLNVDSTIAKKNMFEFYNIRFETSKNVINNLMAEYLINNTIINL